MIENNQKTNRGKILNSSNLKNILKPIYCININYA